MLQEKLKEVKQEVDFFLKDFFNEKKKGIGAVHPEVEKLIADIEDVTLRGGDRFRPFMVWLGAQSVQIQNLKLPASPAGEKVQNESGNELIKLMCSVEILHSFALIHDDIIDRAETRRGGPTIKPDEKAILAGDLCFVFADELLNGLGGPVKKQFDILREEVIAGEWLDVFYTMQRQLLLKEQNYHELLMKIYRYKTVSYTIAQPFFMGVYYAGAEKSVELKKIKEILVKIGIAFQMKDDYLDLFGDRRFGKKIGGDLKEGKLTVFHAKLMEKHVSKKYLKIFGNPNLTIEDVEWVKKIVIELGIKKEIEEEMTRISNEAQGKIGGIKEFKGEAKRLLMEMAEYVVEREY